MSSAAEFCPPGLSPHERSRPCASPSSPTCTATVWPSTLSWPTSSAIPPTRSVCLGDAIQGGPQPAETVARLRELGCPVVMGNADAWLLSGEATGSEATSAAQEAVAPGRSRGSPPPTAPSSPASSRRSPCRWRATATCSASTARPHSFDDIILPETPEEDVTRLLGRVRRPPSCAAATPTCNRCAAWATASSSTPAASASPTTATSPTRASTLDPWAEYAVLTAEIRAVAVGIPPRPLRRGRAAGRATGRRAPPPGNHLRPLWARIPPDLSTLPAAPEPPGLGLGRARNPRHQKGRGYTDWTV